jgi:hypothetical protein
MTGSEFERLPGPARIRVAMASDEADVTADVSFGNVIQGTAISVPLEPAAGVGPRLPDELLIDDMADTNDLILKRLRVGAAISIVRTLVRIDFVGA